MKTTKITSIHNRFVKEALKSKDRPDKTGDLFLIEGPKMVQTALSSGARFTKCFFTEDFAARGSSLLCKISEATGGQGGAVMLEVTEQLLALLSGTESPQGIVALAEYRHAALQDLRFRAVPLLAVCAGVRDPGNMGAIIRTSDAAGADAVIVLAGSCSPFSSKAVRSTAGSLFNIPVVRCSRESLLVFLQGKGIPMYVTDSRAPETVFDTDLTKPVAMLFGEEGGGVDPELRAVAARSVSIPIYGGAESLNVASAAAVCLYEALRQRTVQR